MKRFALMLLLLLILGCGYSLGIPKTERCTLCDSLPHHAPCIVDLNTGCIKELAIYQPHPTKAGELSDDQEDGYMSLVQIGEINGICLGAERVELKAPIEMAGIDKRLFCESCRRLLQDDQCTGYILADLYSPETPIVWKIGDDVAFSVRCYDVQISRIDKSDMLEIFILGTLDIEDNSAK